MRLKNRHPAARVFETGGRRSSPAVRLARVLAAVAAAVLIAEPAVRALPGVTVPAAAPVNPEVVRRRLQSALDGFQAAGRFPGATAGVVLADGTSFGLASGFADADATTPMSSSDRMLMGSVGKTYVVAVALQLVQEKRLALTDRIERWFAAADWFSRLPNAREITVRMLMNHTSGLARYELDERFSADLTQEPERVWRPEDRLAYVLDAEPPFAAGRGWQYSDTNYIVLGMIIERVTGAPYYEEMRRRLLVPFKLRDTVPSDSRSVPGLVQGYAGPQNPFGGTDAMVRDGRLAINPQFEWTGGGLACTAQDLARWAKVLYEGRAFSKARLTEMLAGVASGLGSDTRYGLGVMIRQTPLGVSYGHSGFFPGYLTDVAYFPASRTAAAVQINTSVSDTTAKPLARFLVDLAQAAGSRPPS